MPRAKRKRFSNPRRRRSSQADEASRAPPSPPSSSASHVEDADDDGAAPPSFFNTTFSTHRVSPLYIGPQPLSRHRLGVLARRLRDTLVGDTVRGIEVGLDGGNDTSMTRAGALELVDLRWVRLDALLGLAADDRHHEDGEEGDDTHRPASRDLGNDDVPPDVGRHLSRRQQRRRKALHISLQYENALCTAVLMPDLSADENTDTEASEATRTENPAAADLFGIPSRDGDGQHFVHLPLLLLRMPPPLKPVIVDFLSATFDCRIQPLRLGTRSLVRAWETWVRDAGAGAATRGPAAKDPVLTLGFHADAVVRPEKGSKSQGREDMDSGDEANPVMGLKAIDVIIPAADVKRFVEAGKSISSTKGMHADKADSHSARYSEGDLRKRRKLGGATDEEGWWWRNSTPAASTDAELAEQYPEQPFMEALARYIDHHLALDIFHPAVRITRIACGAFVLSEGRVKIFPPAGYVVGERAVSGAAAQGVQDLVAGLIDRAKGRPLGKG